MVCDQTTSQQDCALKVHGLDVQRDGNNILSAVHCDFQVGEITAIIGPNGAGKSTLLSACMGDVQPTRGQVRLINQPLEDWPDQTRACVLAALSQQHQLNFPFTVEQVVGLGRSPHSTSHKQNQTITQAALNAMDIESLAHKNYLHLSGGEKQRTQIARVLAQIWPDADNQTRVVLLDEPTAALDISHQKQLMTLLNELKHNNLAVVIVVHDLNLVSRYADKVIALQAGAVKYAGTTADVMKKDVLEAVFDTQFRVMHHPDSGEVIISI